jgi:phosphopantothenoylcysteine decarboxylase/phosphopantothenate--cysteine ligase
MTTNQPTRILITAGATNEHIDRVRYLGNRSSGKLGALMAFAAATQGHEVTLLHGQQAVTPACHPRLSAISFSSTRDLTAKLNELWPSHAVLIMAAAVSDYTPRGGQIDGKLKRGSGATLELVPTTDIVGTLANTSREDQKIIAFALEESCKLEISAKDKLARKQVDAIVANPLETMDADSITANIFRKDGSSISPEETLSKAAFSKWLIENLNTILYPTSSAV